ncbi:MAG: hypothetical protein CMI53_03050 [Parcubacteria group bacterium]|nr:hypothetical protein [Parcubacteria group bacterium]|tara:strand:- start:2984 stop:3787 length:804 start_codon:yes stop_codon:yes gene_type:complete
MNNKLTILSFLAIFLLIGCGQQNIDQQQVLDNPVAPVAEIPTKIVEEDVDPENTGEVLGVKIVAEEEVGLSSDFLDNDVIFISQAPYAVWDELHKETCEEAAMVNVVKYFKGEELTAHIMEQELLNLVKWQEQNGYQVDLTAEETAEILENYYNFNSELITEVTVSRIKQELDAGKLIIIPAAGRELKNPYFQTPGPIYHMLVIRGYDEQSQEFITNDVGTKRGAGFRYNYNRLIEAIHDWDHDLAKYGMTDDEIGSGRKVIIAVTK